MQLDGSRPLRVFFALDLPDRIKKRVTKIIEQLQKIHTHHSIRWIQPNNLHITLQFIAAVKMEDIDQLIYHVTHKIKDFSGFDLEIGDLELFPTPYDPHIISLAVGPHDTLANLAKTIGIGIMATGYDIESRPFRGHLTLARIKTNKFFTLSDVPYPEFEKIPVDEVVLYKSKPSQAETLYTPLKKILLKPKI